MSGQPDVSVILVNYKTPTLLYRCIKSIVEHTTEVSYEIIVVDNNSGDDSEQQARAAYGQVGWLQTGYNAGFARANNVGLRNAKGKYALLLNSDAFFRDNALFEFFRFYSTNEKRLNLGLMGCRLIDDNGQLLVGSHIKFPGIEKVINANAAVIFIKKMLRLDIDKGVREKQEQIAKLHLQNHEVSIVSGACVFLNLETLKANNLFFDEDFFLYSEDVEWSWRYMQKGFTNYFYAGIVIIHTDGGSSINSIRKQKQILLSNWLYIYKTRGALYFRLFAALLQFNWLLDRWLYNRRVGKKGAADEKASYDWQCLTMQMFNKYYPIIVNNYSTNPGVKKQYLIYED